MALLKKVRLQGFRSFKSIEVDLGRLNIMIGANGAGKSNFISFFKMLNEMMAGRFQQYIGSTGRAQSLLHCGPKMTPQGLDASLTFELGEDVDIYALRLFYAAGDTLGFAEEKLTWQKPGWPVPQVVQLGGGHQETRIDEFARQGNATAKVFRRILNRCRVYHFHDTSLTSRMRQYCLIDNSRWLMPDAGNLAAMLYGYQNSNEPVYQRIISTVGKIMGGFGDFALEPDRLNPREIQLNWRRSDSDYLFGPHQLSDGTLRAIAIITLLLQPEADLPDIVILDEPELGLHPYALEIVAGLLRAASTRTQVLVATQSQALLNYFEPTDILVAETQGTSSILRRLDADALKGWIEEDFGVGDLWEKNVIGGGPLP
jgi:predicted ATPase